MNLSTKTVAAILERWTEEGIVTDHCAEYGEPGYYHTEFHQDEGDTPIVVLGDYWCRCNGYTMTDGGYKIERITDANQDAKPTLHDHATHHPRLWAQLEAQGVAFEWYDEWTIDYENGKAYRTQPDSYSWQRSFVWTNDGEGMLTPDDDIDAWIEWAAEYHDYEGVRCIPSTVYRGSDLLAAGFEKWNGTYEHGWHPGQNDNPHEIRNAIGIARNVAYIFTGFREEIDVVFAIDGVGQFDVEFSAYYREQNYESTEERPPLPKRVPQAQNPMTTKEQSND